MQVTDRHCLLPFLVADIVKEDSLFSRILIVSQQQETYNQEFCVYLPLKLDRYMEPVLDFGNLLSVCQISVKKKKKIRIGFASKT